MRALEMGGRIDENRRLVLDEALPVQGPSRVRVIVLFDDEAEVDEAEWLRAAARNPAFDFLREPEEDVYTAADGKPFREKG